MRNGDGNLLHASLFSSSSRIAMKLFQNIRGARVILEDLNILQGSAGSLAGDAQRLEDCLLGAPSASERALGASRTLAVSNLLASEVALDEGVILNVDGRDILDIYANVAALACHLVSERLNDLLCLLDSDSRDSLFGRLHEVVGILELLGLLVFGDTSIRVHQNLAELLIGVRSVSLGNEQSVADHAVVEETVSLLLSGLNLGTVLPVPGVDPDCLGSLLSETERGERESLDSIGLDATAGVNNQIVVLHDGVDVVGISVTRDQTSVQDLQATVQHPSTGSTLGDGVTLASAKVTQLLANGSGLVLVVGTGGCTVERGNPQVVNGKTPCCKSTTEGSNGGIALPEVVAHASEELLFLPRGLPLDVCDAILSILLLVKDTALSLHSIDFIVQELQLRLFPLLNRLLAALNLSATVVDVKQWRRELASVLTRRRENTLARSRDGTSNLVRGSGGVSKDTVDRDSHIQSKLGCHDDLDTTSLRLHKAVSGSGLVETTDKTDASLAFQNGLHTYVDRLNSGGTSSDWGLDRSRRREQQHVHPSRHSVDEGFLQDIVLKRLVLEPGLVHATQSRSTTHTRADNVTNFRDVDVLVELVWVGNTRGQESLSSRHEKEQGDRVHLADDIVGDTISLGVPASWDLASDESVEAQGLGDPERGALLHSHSELSRLGDLENLHLVTMFSSELFGSLLGGLEWLKVLFDDNLVKQLLLVGVISIEQLRLNQTDTGVVQNELLVLLLDVLVVDGLTSLGVNPASVRLALERTIVVLDETHDPGHFNATFERELAMSLHLPSGSRVTPGADFCETSDDDYLLQVDHALELVIKRGDLSLPVGQMREVKLDVGTRLDGLLLVKNLRVGSVDNSVLDSALLRNDSTDFTGLHDILAKLGHGLVQVGDELQTTVQTQQVESHLLLREGSDTKRLNTLGDNVVARHETSTASPSDNSTANCEVVAPVLRVPSVEESLKSQLGFGVETVVAKGTMVGRQGKDNLSGTSFEATLRLLSLDVTEHADQVGQHNTVGQLRLGVDAINLSAILGDGGERNDVVEIPAETSLGVVDVVDESFDILLASLVEGDNNDLRSTRAKTGVHGLVVLSHLSGESTGSDHDLGTSADEALQDLGTNGSGTSTSHQNILVLERDAILGSLLERVEIYSGELLAVVPAVKRLSLEMEEGDGLDPALVQAGALQARLSALAVLLENLALVHGQGAQNIAVQALDFELRGLGHLVLLLDQLVDTLQVVLNLGAVAILGDLSTLGHLLNVVLEFSAAGARNFLIVEVATRIHGGARTSGNSNVLVDRRQLQDFLAVLNELLAKFFGQLVGFTALSRAVINVVLHELEKLGV
ncbi:hypothetical protein MKX08_004356 [Trichoderma sp. CBMAI-0020]|nr:hypothetical protein MKX08_004356 [Trichoderma sp. CBMAI-0020]